MKNIILILTIILIPKLGFACDGLYATKAGSKVSECLTGIRCPSGASSCAGGKIHCPDSVGGIQLTDIPVIWNGQKYYIKGCYSSLFTVHLPNHCKNGTTIECSVCNEGYYISGRFCEPCPDNALCANGKDIQCKEGYELNNGSCVISKPKATCQSPLKLSADGCCCLL